MGLFSKLASFLLLSLLTLVPASASASAIPSDSDILERQTPTTCPKGVHIIAARGHGTEPPVGYGRLSTLNAMILKKIPGSTSSYVPYDSSSANLMAGDASGVPLMTTMILDYVKKCPNAKIALLGYSEGALITMDVLCGRSEPGFVPQTNPISPSYTKNIIATIVYGDESRVSGRIYNEGTCELDGPLTRTKYLQCVPYNQVIRSYCDSSDTYCCLGGTTPDHHFDYPPIYDGIASNFVVSKFKA